MKSGYVSIIGQPNTGKSSLLNLILDERLSIVTPKAQTTRHKVVGIHNTKDVQIIFLESHIIKNIIPIRCMAGIIIFISKE